MLIYVMQIHFKGKFAKATAIRYFCISILRSFAVNLYQLFFNKYKGEKIIVEGVQTKKPLTMARTKRYCENSDIFISDIFELQLLVFTLTYFITK